MAGDSKEGSVSLRDEDVTTIAKEFFFEGMTLPVPVYLKMATDIYLLIGKKSEKASFKELHSIKNPETSIYVENKDFADLIEYLTEFTERIVQEKNVPNSTKIKFLHGLADEALFSFDGKGLASAEQLQKVSHFITDLSQSAPNFLEVLDLLLGLPNSDAKHSMTTCVVSLLICEEMQMTHRAALDKLSMGALMHEIGLKSVPDSIMSKPRHLWTPSELQTYEQHPLKGVELLRDLKDISNDILLIVAEHHENAAGTGFPKRIRDVKISPLGRIVGVADCFTDLLFSRLPDAKTYTADEAVTYIEDILGQPFNKQVFSALKNIINKKYLKDKKVSA